MTLYYKNYIEFFYIFKRKGTYKTDIFASQKNQKKRDHLVEYRLECTEEFKKLQEPLLVYQKLMKLI